MTSPTGSGEPADRGSAPLQPRDQVDATVEALRLVGRAYRKFFHRQRVNDLSPQEFGLMHHLAMAGDRGENPSAIAEALEVARPNVTSLIRKLKNREYVGLSPDPDDRRGRVVALTPLGAGFLAENRKRLRKRMKEDFGRLSEAEQRRLEILAREMAVLLERAFA